MLKNIEIPETTPEAPEKEITPNTFFTSYIQWLYEGKQLIPLSKTTPVMPAGVYNLVWNCAYGMGIPEFKDINTDELFILPLPIMKDVLKDIQAFWEKEKEYADFGSIYKRGILLYGIPGCGKSSIIAILIKELIEKHKGVVFTPSNSDELHYLIKIIPIVKDIESNKRIIVVIEDIDNFLTEGKGNQEQTILLNFLDGASCQNGVVTIATTNYPERLQERITNRPSRFDRRYEVGKPNAEVRRFYIKAKLKFAGKDVTNPKTIEEIVRETEGFTIDHLKEYLLSIFVLDYTMKKALSEIREISKIKILKNTKEKSDIGFNTEK